MYMREFESLPYQHEGLFQLLQYSDFAIIILNPGTEKSVIY